MEPQPTHNVQAVVEKYPPKIQTRIRNLRTIVYEVARDMPHRPCVDETLKWGQPSYRTKGGSPLRMAWRGPDRPEEYALFFHCQSMLIPTFKELYTDVLDFDGNRAIVFWENKKIPKKVVSHCIELALSYHKRKHLPLLGA